MPKLYPSKAILLLALLTCTACENPAQSSRLTSSSAAPSGTAEARIPEKAEPTSAQVTSASDLFQSGLERAASASRLGESAQSSDDWQLVANRWQQAVNAMKSVSTAHPRYAQAQHKLAEYQQNLAQSQQQVKRSTKLLNPDGVVILSPSSRQPSTRTVAAARPVAAVPAKSLPPESKPDPDRIFYAPIVRREGNTPVIRVLFNDAQSFDMIVDTGASGTLITQQMAKTLGVVPVSQANVDTASQRGVTFPLGYVSSIKVGGATATNVLIAMAGPDLNVGLLGHDFFGHYDVTIREKEVEFRER